MITTDRLAELAEEAMRNPEPFDLDGLLTGIHADNTDTLLFEFELPTGTITGWMNNTGESYPWEKIQQMVLREATLPLHAGEIERLKAENARLREVVFEAIGECAKWETHHAANGKHGRSAYWADLASKYTAALQETPRD